MTTGTAAILAGGGGKRLGGLAKESLAIAGESAGPRLVRLLQGRFDPVLVVTRNAGLYRGTGAVALCDLVPGFGPLSGLHAALCASGTQWLWLAACDMPAFDPRLVDLLLARLEAAITGEGATGSPPLACLARHGNHFEPFQALYSRALIPHLEALFSKAAAVASAGAAAGGVTPPPRSILQPSFKELFGPLPVEFVPEADVRELSPGWEAFFNLNTFEDLNRYQLAGKRTIT